VYVDPGGHDIVIVGVQMLVGVQQNPMTGGHWEQVTALFPPHPNGGIETHPPSLGQQTVGNWAAVRSAAAATSATITINVHGDRSMRHSLWVRVVSPPIATTSSPKVTILVLLRLSER
jgi:hypothetical protein